MTEAATSNEPRGIAAAMSQPVFSTRMGQSALGVADRATRRWAPEAAEDQPRSMRSLSFVDRMVSPWVTAAQQSAGLRMFSQYAANDVPERNISGVSWVFPRPWYQDELDWISASRASRAGQDMIFTTRGTYAAASSERQRETSVPPQLFEFVAPSFAPANSESSVSAYSPLVSHSSYSAASVVAQSMQVIQAASAMARGLPARMSPSAVDAPSAPSSFGSFGSLAGVSSLVGSLIPDGESSRFSVQPSALAMRAPQMVTPPSPRPESGEAGFGSPSSEVRSEHAAQSARSQEEAAVAQATAVAAVRQEQSRAMAVAFAQERERVAEQMRVNARAERARSETSSSAESSVPASVSPVVADAAIHEAIRAEVVRQEAARARETSSRVRSAARQQARIDAIVAERVAQLETPAASTAPAAPSVLSMAQASAAAQAPAAPSEAQSQAMVQALRMAELLAHSAAVGPSAMAPSAGPRMALPSGLGGLVSGMNTVAVIHRERALATEPAQRREGASLPFVAGFQPVYTAPVAAEEHRATEADGPVRPRAAIWAPRMAASPEAMRPDSALGAIASQSPAALGHVAWADRWLGRFAGASEAALDAMSTVAMRARLAPTQMFVAPMLDAPRREAVESSARFAAPTLDVVAPRQEAPAVTQAPRFEVPRAATPIVAPQRTEALRFADDDVVPDELFAAIAAGPARQAPRAVAPTGASASTSTSVPGAATPVAASAARTAAMQPSAADIVALTAPSAPVDAGLSAALAASPMAPALGHVLSLPRAAVFDPRSLGGSDLAAAFLAGAVSAPMVAQVNAGPLSSSFGSFSSAASGAVWEPASHGESPSLWRQWSAELVRPAELTRAAMSEDGVISSAMRPSLTAPSTPSRAETPTTSAAAEAAAIENIITLRSTLLSPPSPRQQRLAASAGTASSWANHEPADALPVAYQTLGELLSEAAPDRRWLSSMPTTAAEESAPSSFGWDSPAMASRFDQGFPLVFWPQAVNAAAMGTLGATSFERSVEAPRGDRAAATRAPAWSSPELEQVTASAALVEQGVPGSMDRGALSPGMLAQRALGFGAVQSNQTADLSFDFVPPELVLAARVYGFGAAEAAQAARLAMGGATGLSAMAGAVDLRFVSLASPTRVEAARGESARDFGGYSSARAADEPSREPDTAFGVQRRMPRGAFLLPSASVAAMGLSAAVPDGEHGMSIAALEVLAAKMVAELGSFASPSLGSPASASGGAEQGASPARRAPGATMLDLSTPVVGSDGMEASEAAVLSSASASVATSRRARFESLYVALAETPSGRTMSPAARAARALALANRDEDASALSSRERAALAWQIYPVVLSGDAAASPEAREAQESRGESSSARGRSPLELPTLAAFERPGAEMRPGLSPLSSRAGEALSSFVTTTPSQPEQRSAPSSESRSGSSSWRSGRFGGGEVEIPEWFESAARKMFEERGDIEGMSLAELTLVASTPPAQIAASTREAPSAVPPKQASPDGKGDKGQKVDIEKVAGEVYRAVMQLMESARMRNGEPYL